MKKIIQIFLTIFIIICIFFFNKIYFTEEKKIITKNETLNNTSNEKIEDNVILNLKYEVKLKDGKNYLIKSKFSKLLNLNGSEIIAMEIVDAEIINKDNESLKIKSEQAEYDNNSYKTKFMKNVLIIYNDNIITSDVLNLDIKNNEVLITGNVKYIGLLGTITTENIKINLITKKIDIYVSDENNKINLKIY